jgi:UDP-GlcNAc:undecaprenyl-phosphate/decaprenyl-phosphate GlcNAc-1-phosphate transferase
MFLLVPVLDTSQVIVRRLLAGKNPMSTPGKDHIHHRLLAWGFSQRDSAVILWGATLSSNLVAMWLQGTRLNVILTTALGTTVLLGLTVWRRVQAAAILKKKVQDIVEPLNKTDITERERPSPNTDLDS